MSCSLFLPPPRLPREPKPGEEGRLRGIGRLVTGISAAFKTEVRYKADAIFPQPGHPQPQPGAQLDQQQLPPARDGSATLFHATAQESSLEAG